MDSSLTQAAQDCCRAVLFGGSSVSTTYLPEPLKHHRLLWQSLEAAYPAQRIEVINQADNGEFIARYLLGGKYERHRQSLPGMDLAIIRFGTNDQKRFEVDEYREQCLRFIEVLRADFPDAALFLETGMYIDYPAHYTFDRNVRLDPYWEIARSLAAELGLGLIDVNEATRKATLEGNWDLRVRNSLKTLGRFILDDSLDHDYPGDARWFSDIHPNPEGVKLSVAEEAAVLRRAFPQSLPTGGRPVSRAPRDPAYYEKILGCPVEVLAQPPKNGNDDQLQRGIM